MSQLAKFTEEIKSYAGLKKKADCLENEGKMMCDFFPYYIINAKTCSVGFIYTKGALTFENPTICSQTRLFTTHGYKVSVLTNEDGVN